MWPLPPIFVTCKGAPVNRPMPRRCGPSGVRFDVAVKKDIFGCFLCIQGKYMGTKAGNAPISDASLGSLQLHEVIPSIKNKKETI